MYPYKYYRYINLPKVPKEVVDQIVLDFDQYEKKDKGNHGDLYKWSDSFNSAVDEWCKQNICDEMWWAFQFIKGPLKPHIDVITKYKFVYLLDTGGSNVETKWYSDDQCQVVDSVILEPERWHILRVDCWHSVDGVDPGSVRYSITGRLF